MMRLTLPMMALAAVAASDARAADWSVTAHVTAIEASYAPNQIPFQIDVAAGTCPSGSFLFWNASGTSDQSRANNSQMIAAALLTAKATGQPVVVYGFNAGCTVQNLWIK